MPTQFGGDRPVTSGSPAASFSHAPRNVGASIQGTMPSHYSFGVRLLSMLAFAYVTFAFINGKFLHWFTAADGTAPIWLSHWTEYAVILVFGVWRTTVERNPYTRKRLAFLTGAVAIFWWFLPNVLRLPEPYMGALPGQPIFPQLHAPGTLTFFAILLLVVLFGRRVVCGWNCPCVGIRETVGFAFRDKTPRGETAWAWRHTKWVFFALYMTAFALIMFSGTAYVSPFYGGFLSLVGVTYFGSFFIAPLTGNRFYCRYLCPYGATFGILNHVGYYGIRMDKSACIDCQRCEQVCDMGIPVWTQGKEHGRVTGLEDCMGCGRCVVGCPTDALEFRDIRNEFLPNLKMNGSYLIGAKRTRKEIAPRMAPGYRPAAIRRADWQEDRHAFSFDDAVTQARRCLDCGVPGCQNACPLNNRIPVWLEALGKGDVEGAAALCHSTSNLPEICGTLCPSHRLCEGSCTLKDKGGAVTIGALERFINDEAFRRGWRADTPPRDLPGAKIAVIGAGPAGLACADELNKAGHRVSVIDKANDIGGLLAYGVPAFKLYPALLQRRKALLQEAGIQFQLGVAVDTPHLERIIDTHDAVYLGTGVQSAKGGSMDGQDLGGVMDGIRYLSTLAHAQHGDAQQAPDVRGKEVIVLGGGDTAMDCARSAVRQGAGHVTIAYRRAAKHMRAQPKEIRAAREEGVAFLFDKQPQSFVGEATLEGVRFKNDPQPHACDVAIVAFGQEMIQGCPFKGFGIETDADGLFVHDDRGRTSHPKVFVGGDNGHGPDLVVTAVAAGRRASVGILEALSAR